jgi:hypothetical protein
MLRYYRGHRAAASLGGGAPEIPYSLGIFSIRAPEPGGFPGLAAFPCAPGREFSGAEQRTARAYQAFRYRCSQVLARARSYAGSMWRF